MGRARSEKKLYKRCQVGQNLAHFSVPHFYHRGPVLKENVGYIMGFGPYNV